MNTRVLSPAAVLAALLLAPSAQTAHAADAAPGAGVAAAAADTGNDSRTAALEALAAGVTAGDARAILAARANLAAMAAGSADDASLQYWLAVADWRAVPLMAGDDKGKKAAQRQCEAGLAAAERATQLAPSDAEAIALHAGLEGLSLSFKNPMAAMTLGPKMEEEMQKALTLAPNNPRVMLLDAINTFHKPAFVGGGAKNAREKLEKARAAFEAEPTTPEHWGHDDVYVWLGRAAMELDDWTAAETWLEKALEVSPGHAWVGKVLLPKVREQLAKQAG